MPMWLRVFRIWLPVATVGTVLAFVSYVSVRQSYRMGLDDPQIQLAQDAAAQLDSGIAATEVVGSDKIDADKSLAPFLIVYGADNAPIASSAVLGDTVPKVPSGVLETARTRGVDKVTWQPRAGVRIASVSVAAKDGRVVLSGRNMREVESRISALTRMSFLGWLIAMIASLFVTGVIESPGKRSSRNRASIRAL